MTEQDPKSISVGLLIFPGFPMACLTSIIEPLRVANEISGTRAFAWSLIGEDYAKVTASAEIEFEPAQTLAAAKGLDYLILLSSPSERFANLATAANLRAQYRHGVTLGAVSGGVFPLVRAGIAVQTPLSVHWCYRAAFEAEFPKTVASDQVVEIGARLATASGAAAAFDLALHMIEARLTAAVATEVACWFQHPMMRREGVQQAVPALGMAETGERLPELIARAAALLAENIAEPIAIAEVAKRLNVTSRHLERSFKSATNLSPSHYYRKLRMQAARQIVLYTNDRLIDVALAVGYSSTQAFAKHYYSAFGMTPTDDRKRINLYRVESNRPVPSF